MSKTTLVSRRYKKGEYAGQTVIMPHLGSVTFEDDGSLKLDSDIPIEDFLKDTVESFNFEVKSDKVKKEVVSKVKGKAKEEEQEEEEKEVDPGKAAQEKFELEEKLNEMTSKELLELAKDAKFINVDVAAWSDKKLKKELLKKLLE